MDFVTFTVIVDDIVYPDGHTRMACLGGGGTQTAFGMKLWTTEKEKVGLAACVGSDFPSSCRTWLEEMEINIAGLYVWPYPTLRAWQLLEEDGRRGQVWRVDVKEPSLRPAMENLPPAYRTARAYHACVHPSGQDGEFIRNLRNTGATAVSIEPYTHAQGIVTRSELQALIAGGHIFSPTEKEAASLVGPGPPLDLISRLVELGAEVVSLRRGPLGCIVHRSDTGETWEVPSFHSIIEPSTEAGSQNNIGSKTGSAIQDCGIVGVVDPTGCGNTFCGGFLAGWVKTNDLLTAALWGTIAASFMVEHEGVPPASLSSLRAQANARLGLLRAHAKRLGPV